MKRQLVMRVRGISLLGAASMVAMSCAVAVPTVHGQGHEHGQHQPAAAQAAKNQGHKHGSHGGERKSGFVTMADGARIHYIEAGQSWTTGTVAPGKAGGPSTAEIQKQPSILFVPGWTMTAEIWEAQIAHFAQTNRVVAMDPRAQGKSSKTNEGLYPAARARDIRTLVEKLKLEPVVLVGWSMGVMEVTSYVAEFGTEGIEGIVLVDGTAGVEFPPEVMKLWIGWLGGFVKDRAKANDGFVRSMFKKPQTEEYIARVKKSALETPTPEAMSLILGMMTTDNRPVLAKIDRPTLITIAPGGPWDAAYVEMQKAIPGARMERFEGAGHALFVDEAEKFNALLEEFVTGLAK